MTVEPKGRVSAVDAKSFAQLIAFAPFAFHASIALRDTGILACLDEAGRDGLTLAEIAGATGLSEYSVSVLVDIGRDLGIVEETPAGFALGTVGHFLLHDEMTRVNMDFTRDLAYRALPHLEASVRSQRPAGLATLGPWETIYEGLASLPEPARSSWLRFDHFHSDRAFHHLLPLVFASSPRHIMDVGANTGRWALKCLAHDPDVRLSLVDLPAQLDLARRSIEHAGWSDRVRYHPANLLEQGAWLPEGADVIWMSQFLDCFSESEVARILQAAVAAMDSSTRLYIVELFPDRQRFEAARFSLNATSLYFTCIANGNSRMYPYRAFRGLVEDAGLQVTLEKDLAPSGHTVLQCRTATS
jgi:ubiquinone/menaquinone biosynthesis C-methylase UbiE